jgi:hypothetical protein
MEIRVSDCPVSYGYKSYIVINSGIISDVYRLFCLPIKER